MSALIGNIIAIAIVSGLVITAIRNIRKNAMNGGCCGGCSGCTGTCPGCSVKKTERKSSSA